MTSSSSSKDIFIVKLRPIEREATEKKKNITNKGEKKRHGGPVRESNPGPLAPKARIMPLDQQAALTRGRAKLEYHAFYLIHDLPHKKITFFPKH